MIKKAIFKVMASLNLSFLSVGVDEVFADARVAGFANDFNNDAYVFIQSNRQPFCRFY